MAQESVVKRLEAASPRGEAASCHFISTTCPIMAVGVVLIFEAGLLCFSYAPEQ